MIEPDPTFDWIDSLSMPIGPPDLRMGLRALDIHHWLPVDSNTEAELALRARLLEEHDGLVQLIPGHDDAVHELMSLVDIHLRRPTQRTSNSALEQLAVSVPDDVLLMWRDDAHWRLVGGTLLFPNQWTLDEKLGRTIGSIHAPVDGYDELLEDRVNRYFDKLTAARPVWRRNWFFHDDPNFFQPRRVVGREIVDAAEVETLWLRSEWQTLRRLAFSGLVVFTVKTQIAPMSEIAARPDIASQMIDFLAAASERSLDNKDALGRRDAIVHYLQSSLGAHAGRRFSR